MTQTNINILEGYFNEVINQKRIDLLPKYYSEKFIGHGAPYVGMGVMIDDSSGDSVVITSIYPGSPGEGKLMVGDEIMRAYDGEHTWQTYEVLRRGGLWGQGVIGTPVTVGVRREGREQEITITRGLVPGFKYPYGMVETWMREYFSDWPDLKASLENVIESGDMVAYLTDNQGHNIRYGRSAVWREFGLVRIQDGKLTERWESDEGISQFRQLGYTILAPALVTA